MSGHRTVGVVFSSPWRKERSQGNSEVVCFLYKAEFFQLKVLAFNQRLWIFCFIGVKTPFLY